MDIRELSPDYEESLRMLVDTALLHTWTALPGIVQAFDEERMSCDVQVTTMFNQIQTDPKTGAATPKWIKMAVIPDVPVVFQGGGGFVLSFKPKAGDECLVIFSSRCISGWWAQGGVQPQPILRHHSLSDGFCIIGPRSFPNVLTGISDNAQLRTVDGSAYIELTPTGEVNIKAPGGVTITGDLKVTGDTIGTGEGTFNSIPVSTHLHPGVQAGGSDTGAPIP